MAKLDVLLVVLLIPCNEILCVWSKNDDGLVKPSPLKNYRHQLNVTKPKHYNKKYPNNHKAKLTSSDLDHTIPYSEHEDARNVSTKPKYTVNGELIHANQKEPDFIPTKLYAQVRGKHTVKRVPKKYAIGEAKTDEEKENANRLREIVTNKKTNTIYTEEGYEDSAYDHAGHIRDADFEEKYGRKLNNQYDANGQSDHPKKLDKSISLGSDVLEAGSSRKNNINENIHPQSVVLKGIRNLENDIVKEIEKTERNADEYHKRVSQVKASRENDDNGEDDYDDEVNNSDNRSDNSSPSFENNNSQMRIESRENNYSTKTTQRYPEDVSGSEQSEEDRSHNSNSQRVENEHLKSADVSTGNDSSAQKYIPNVLLKKNKDTYSDYIDSSELKSEPKNYKLSKDKAYLNFDKLESYTPTLSDYLTESPVQLRYGDILWQGFQQRQKLRGLNNLKQYRNGNPSTLVTNKEPIIPQLGTEPETIEPLTVKPIEYEFVDNTIQKNYQTDIPFISIEKPIETTQIEPFPLAPSLPEPFISFEPVTALGYYKVTEETTTSAYPTTPYETTYSAQTTNIPEKQTEYDHNPFLSPFAKQFDRKLKRYHPIARETEEQMKNDNHLTASKYKTKNKNVNDLKTYQKNKAMYVNDLNPLIPKSYKPKTQKQQNSVPSENDLRIMRPPKPITFRSLYNPYTYRKSIYGRVRPYDPILNDYILPRIVRDHFGTALNLHPSAVTQKSVYSGNNLKPYNDKVIARYIYPNYIVKPKYIRFKRSLSAFDVVSLNQIWNNVNSNDNSTFAEHSEKDKLSKYHEQVDLLEKSPKIAESVVDEEIAARFPVKYNITKANPENSEHTEVDVEVEVPELDDFLENKEEYEKQDYFDAEEQKLDTEKYPYYDSDIAKSDSILKYILNPNFVPKKTFGGMEFYDSRILKCNEIEPNIDDVPPSDEEPATTRGYNEKLPRLIGLGDKLDCYKAKYFDPNPLDNPLFMEKRIDELQIPKEIDPKAFSSKISTWSNSKDEYTQHKLSKTPEHNRKHRESNDSKFKKLRTKPKYNYKWPHRYSHSRKRVPYRRRKKLPSHQFLVPLRLYGNQVYDDVMGTIKKSKTAKKRKRIYRQPQYDSSISSYSNIRPSEDSYLDYSAYSNGRPPEDSYAEYSAVKLRFIANNSKRFPMQEDDSIPMFDIPTEQLPRKVRLLKGGPYKSVNITKPKGSLLKINYLGLPPLKRHKRSAEKHNQRAINQDNPVITNSHQLTLDPIIVRDFTIKNNHPTLISENPTSMKNSKPEKIKDRYGLYTNPLDNKNVDSRRQELRYNPIEEDNFEHSTTIKAPLRIVVKDESIPHSASPSFSIPIETVFRVNHEQNHSSRPKYREIDRNSSKLLVKAVSPKKIGKRYEVHEIPNEDEKPNPMAKLNSTVNEKDYSVEADEETSSRSAESDRAENRKYENNENSKEEQRSSSKEEESSRYHSSEENSPNVGAENLKEEDDYSGEVKDDENNFKRFNSRPWSPPEYYHDPKYANLGPRVNKPAFYHPSFKTPKYEHYKFGKHVEDISESMESDESEEKPKYLYPWEKTDSDESKHFVHSIKRYEYPWEKRERLAKEKNRKASKNDYYASEEDRNEEDEEGTASSEDYYTYYNPWNIRVYKTPKRKIKHKSDFLYDTEESTSNIKPTVTQTEPRPNITIKKINESIIHTDFIESPIFP